MSAEYGGGSIPVELVVLAPAVSPESPLPCDPISAWALALRLLSSEPHRVQRCGSKPFPSEGLQPTLARWGRVSSLTLKAYRSPEIPLRRVNGSPRVADFGSQGTAGSPILLPPPKQKRTSHHINRPSYLTQSSGTLTSLRNNPLTDLLLTCGEPVVIERFHAAAV